MIMYNIVATLKLNIICYFERVYFYFGKNTGFNLAYVCITDMF